MNKQVAIGRIGYDLHMEQPQFERQQHAQLKLTERYNLLAILHSRHSHEWLTVIGRRSEMFEALCQLCPSQLMISPSNCITTLMPCLCHWLEYFSFIPFINSNH
nr:TatD family hydrolase [Serratia odorifera]